MGSQQAHNRLQRTLVDRLKEKGYSRIYENTEYHICIHDKVYDGEVDVLALSPYNEWHFYEIKSGKGKIVRAQSQFDRFKLTHPLLEVKGVYVSPYKVKRLV